MNKQQKDYAVARARYEVLRRALDKMEADVMKKQRIFDANGTRLCYIWQIQDDDKAFESLTDEFLGIPEVQEVNDAYLAATKAKGDAEEALIEYGLSIVEDKELVATLRRGLANGNTRQKLIDATFHLDTGTVPQQA